MSIKKAAKTFSIPRGTLQNRVHNRTKKSDTKSGPSPILLPNEEKDIVNWIVGNARKGFPRRDSDVFFVVKEFLDACPRKNPFIGASSVVCFTKLGEITNFLYLDNMPGNSWYKSFRRRHPIVRERNAEAVTSSSGKVSESDIRKWFKEVGGYFHEHGLMSVLEDPTRVFNSGETSFMICPKTGRVLAPKGQLHTIILQNVFVTMWKQNF